MTDTTHLGLPLIEDSQAQKHVTHNDALRILDAVIQIVVDDITRTAPPTSPTEGQRHVVASDPSGAWAGHAGTIATWQDGAWVFLTPKTGWCLWSVADMSIFIFDGSAWLALAPLANDVGQLGVNTTASTPNLLSVKSNAALLTAITTADGGSGDARLQIAKEATGNTASVVFSDNYSGRAEFGLTGDDHFRLKVSPNGASWQSAFTIDKTTANVSFNGFIDAVATRGQLSAAPIDALGAMTMFPNGGFEGGAEASAVAIALTATSTLQSVAVLDGVTTSYRGSFVAAVQQVASPFAGGRYALKYTVSSAQASLGANDELCCVLTVPGLQSAKLALGTANAQPQSLGFWFQAHRTGAYSGSIRNGSKARSCPFSFTVTTADTPQWISLTGIAGDTSGTWSIDPGVGMMITICLAAGTSRVGTAAAWASADYSGVTGTVNGVAATSDVFHIGNVISLPGNGLPDAAHAAFAMKPRNEMLRTDAQSLSAAMQAQARTNLDLIKQASNVDTTANRVLMSGSFGIGNAIVLTGINVLADRPSGQYFVTASTTNMPPGAGDGYLYVTRLDVNNVIFDFQECNTTNRWICVKGSGAYSPWVNNGSAMDAARAFRRGNVLGTVAQTGGVPTGALIEYATNASGWYVRFADGLQICGMPGKIFTDITTSIGALWQGAQVSVSLPASFISSQYAIYGSTDSTNIWAVLNPNGTGTFYAQMFCIGSVSGTRSYNAVAIGRWF
ncbi:MAG: DUF2793 domain-containing protein [Xanthobacteraceae bacterium]